MKAFPKTGDMCESGMDLRDYFAAKAMAALLISHPHYAERLLSEMDDYDFMEVGCIAEGAYDMANAMMKARVMKARAK